MFLFTCTYDHKSTSVISKYNNKQPKNQNKTLK